MLKGEYAMDLDGCLGVVYSCVTKYKLGIYSYEILPKYAKLRDVLSNAKPTVICHDAEQRPRIWL